MNQDGRTGTDHPAGVAGARAVLLVDDDPAWLRSLTLTLRTRAGLEGVQTCEVSAQVMARLDRGGIGVVVLDLGMPPPTGEQLLRAIAEQHPEIVVLVISGQNQLETAVHCMRSGAFDYFQKTEEPDRIAEGVLRALRMAELRSENREMARRLVSGQLEHPEAFEAIVTVDDTMLRVFSYIEAVARSPQPLLVTGESGVGKDLIVQAAHRLSGRTGPLVTVNVAGLDDAFLSDTLFGHVAGAYTGAAGTRQGMIEAAANGTLFLDEIGDLSAVSQVKLLRLLQDGEYHPIGSDRPRRSRARIIVATHQDLTAREAAGQFRRDLYYRLRFHHVEIPPLRQRRADLAPLLDTFLEQAATDLGKPKPTAPPTLLPLLAAYHFPGNVRELRAMVFDAVSVHRNRMLSTEVFAGAMGTSGVAAPPPGNNPFAEVEPLPTLRQAADLLVEAALARAGGSQTLAARLIGVSQPALSKRLRARR